MTTNNIKGGLCLKALTLGAMLLLILFSACKKTDSVNTTVTPVATLFSPNDSVSVDLSATASVVFEWDAALAADGGLVLYSLAFDKPGGDFSKPVYTLPSDGNGLYTKATLTKEILNQVARLAGIQPLGTGKFIWTVYSSKGVNKVKAGMTRNINITRALGVDNPPADVYITGTATEGGSDLSKALKFKQTASGKYEIYTSLAAGTYHFVSANTGTPNVFYTDVDGKTLRQGTGETTVTGATKEVRIRLDFNVVSVQNSEIKNLALWFAPINDTLFHLDYSAGGVWSALNKPIVFHQESWGRDERYKFRMLINDGTADSYEWWGSVNSDNSRPDASTPLSFWFLYPVDNSQYNYCFKFNGGADNHNCDINMYYTADKANYTHEVIIK
ncbi:MAG TPA: SusE domain-containing protein [Puia sp.]